MLVLKLKKIFPFLLLSFPVVIDIINGYLRGTDGTGESLIGILYRGMIILFSAIYLFRTKYSNYIKILILSSIALLIYHILIGAYSNGVFMALIKIMNFYFVLSIILKSRYFSDRETVVKAAVLYGVLAAIVLIYCFITGAGYAAYTENTFGTKGFFVAMNDVGLTILLLNILACYSFQKTGDVFYFIALIIMSIGSCFVGSVACYLGTAFILLFFALSILFVKFEDYKSSYKVKLITLLLVLVIFNYALVKVISVIQEDSYLSKKYENIGAIFLDAGCEPDFSSENSIVYGHNLKNGQMFGMLKKHYDTSYNADADYKDHQKIWIITPQEEIEYQVFAAREIDVPMSIQ